MKTIKTAAAFLVVFSGFGLAFGPAAAGNPILGGIALIGLCLLAVAIAPR